MCLGVVSELIAHARLQMQHLPVIEDMADQRRGVEARELYFGRSPVIGPSQIKSWA